MILSKVLSRKCLKIGKALLIEEMLIFESLKGDQRNNVVNSYSGFSSTNFGKIFVHCVLVLLYLCSAVMLQRYLMCVKFFEKAQEVYFFTSLVTMSVNPIQDFGAVRGFSNGFISSNKTCNVYKVKNFHSFSTFLLQYFNHYVS